MADVLIVGGGPSACSAAVTLRLRGKSVLMAYADDGALGKARRVENYPGLPGISGSELLAKMRAQASDMGVEIRRAAVQRVLPMGKGFSAMIGQEIAQTRGVILALGVRQARLLPGEEALAGRGVSYCATCDGMLYRGKRVAVIGAWPEAVAEANFLSTLANVAYFCEKPHDTAALAPAVALSALRPEGLSQQDGRVAVKTAEGEETFDGVFVLRPVMATRQLMPELAVKDGQIVVKNGCESSVPGVMIAGDMAGPPYQAAKAVGDGNVAALRLAEYLDANA